jgi:hypothetical protein
MPAIQALMFDEQSVWADGAFDSLTLHQEKAEKRLLLLFATTYRVLVDCQTNFVPGRLIPRMVSNGSDKIQKSEGRKREPNAVQKGSAGKQVIILIGQSHGSQAAPTS